MGKETRADGRLRILRAAAEVFERDGYQTASMARVAQAAGVSKGLPYHYFESKSELARAVVAEHLRSVTDTLSGWPSEAAPTERLRWFTREALTHALAHQRSYRLHLSLALHPDTRLLVMEEIERRSEELGRLDAALRSIFEDLGRADPDTEALILRATVDGLIQYLLLAPAGFPLDEAVERVVLSHAAAHGGV